jgi:hypothetical protein
MGIIAGILLVLLSIAHNVYGEKKQIPDLKALTDDAIIIGSQRVMIFQGGILLFAVGMVQIFSAINIIELVGIARYFPLGVVAINFSTFLLTAITVHRELLTITIPQIVIFVIIMGLQLISL